MSFSCRFCSLKLKIFSNFQLPKFGAAYTRISTPKTVNWDQATVVDLSIGKGVVVPIKYEKDLFIRTTQGGQNNFHLNNMAHLLVYQSKGNYHAEVITGFPDTNYLKNPRGSFSGMVYIEDWAGNSLAKYLYQGKQILKYAPSGLTGLSHSSSPVQSLSAAPIEVCYQLTGYNYSTASPYGGYAWSEAPVCMPSMVPIDDPADGYPSPPDYGVVASGSSSAGGSDETEIVSGHNPIANITDYLKCFTNSGGNDHTYTVTVCVNQPVPGSRTAWTSTPGGPLGTYQQGNFVSVGHTFLVFTEQYGGSTITRNAGFYPTDFVTPGTPSCQGQLNNDENHEYDISASFSVTNADFFNMLSYVSKGNNRGLLYNLNSENCTTFALQTLTQGNINLPSSIGQWPDGAGNNPGDLGEDMLPKRWGI